MSDFCYWIRVSFTKKTVFTPHIDHGEYMSARCMSPHLDIFIMVYCLKFMSSFCDRVSFSIAIQSSFTIFGPHIDHWGHMSGSMCHLNWCLFQMNGYVRTVDYLFLYRFRQYSFEMGTEQKPPDKSRIGGILNINESSCPITIVLL